MPIFEFSTPNVTEVSEARAVLVDMFHPVSNIYNAEGKRPFFLTAMSHKEATKLGGRLVHINPNS